MKIYQVDKNIENYGLGFIFCLKSEINEFALRKHIKLISCLYYVIYY